jgi:hypothetical protein
MASVSAAISQSVRDGAAVALMTQCLERLKTVSAMDAGLCIGWAGYPCERLAGIYLSVNQGLVRNGRPFPPLWQHAH